MRAAWMLVLGAVVAVAGFWGPSWLVQRPVAALLRERLQATGEISVGTRASLVGLVRHRIERVDVTARGVRVGDVIAERFSATLHGITVTRVAGGALALGGIESGSAELTIGQADLERFLRDRGVGSPSVALDASGVTATGDVRVGPVLVSARMRGQFAVTDTTDLSFRPESFEVNGVVVPGPLVAGFLAATTRPVVSVRGLPVAMAIERVTSEPGRITVFARIGTSPP
jgi:hypothetical protein